MDKGLTRWLLALLPMSLIVASAGAEDTAPAGGLPSAPVLTTEATAAPAPAADSVAPVVAGEAETDEAASNETAPAPEPSQAAAPEEPTAEPAADLMAPAKAAGLSNALGWRILGDLVGASDAQAPMVAVAPLSVSTALAAVGDGASGDQRQSLATMFGIAPEGFTDLAGALGELGAAAAADSEVTLAAANSLWISEELELKPDYVERQREALGLGVEHVDFSRPETVDTINAWVAERTADRITDLIDGLGPQTVFVLVNALYFKGAWLEPFDAADTTEGAFTLADGGQVQVPMMTRKGTLLYHEDALGQLARLPFSDEDYSLTLVLPADGAVLASGDGLTALRPLLETATRPLEVELVLPKIDLYAQKNLLDVLVRLGLVNSGEFAELFATPSQGAPIGRVEHAVSLRWDETGAEAAAATAVITTRGGLAPPVMRLDRPFLALIEDRARGTVLFMAIVRNPEATGE